MPYGMVPRALSRLGIALREGIPRRAEAEERRTRTEFDIERARGTIAHRERVFEAGEEEKAETRAYRAKVFGAAERERVLTRPVKQTAAAEARVKLEEIGKRREWGKQPYNFLDAVYRFGGKTEEEIIRLGSNVMEAYKHFPEVQWDEGQKALIEDGKVVTRDEAYQPGSKHMSIVMAETDPFEQAKARGESTKPEDLIPRYEKKISGLRRAQGMRYASPEFKQYMENKISDTQKSIDRLSKEKLAKVKGKEKKEPTAKFTYYDTKGKPHTQYIPKRQVPAAEAEVRKRGGTMEKPGEKAKPTAAKQKAVIALIDKYMGEDKTPLNAEQRKSVNIAAGEFGFEYKEITRPLTKEEKSWSWGYLWGKTEKKYWALVPKTTTRRDKGLGYFGELKRPDGMISTELSIGVNIDGKEMEIPSLVPTLNDKEIDYLLKGNKPTEEIVGKAVKHAKTRIKQGKSPFAEKGEQLGQKVRVKISQQGISKKEMGEIDKVAGKIPFSPTEETTGWKKYLNK